MDGVGAQRRNLATTLAGIHEFQEAHSCLLVYALLSTVLYVFFLFDVSLLFIALSQADHGGTALPRFFRSFTHAHHARAGSSLTQGFPRASVRFQRS